MPVTQAHTACEQCFDKLSTSGVRIDFIVLFPAPRSPCPRSPLALSLSKGQPLAQQVASAGRSDLNTELKNGSDTSSYLTVHLTPPAFAVTTSFY